MILRREHRTVIAVLCALSAGATVAGATAPTSPESAHVERQLLLMGTEARITVVATDRAAALAASEIAVATLAATEERLSTWRPDSELSRLNQAPAGDRHHISQALAADLEAARGCFEATAGAFDPTVGALATAWGLRDGGKHPSAAEITLARQSTGMDQLDLQQSWARRSAGVMIEEGGFGKGAGLTRATRALASDPQVLEAAVDLGGQIALVGADASWTGAVAAPDQRSLPVLAISIDSGSLATSGNSERGIEVDGQRFGHLLDPRTGYPAADFGSLTVWAEDPLRADCLSTGLYVLGPDAALAWTARNPGVEALILEPSGDGRYQARATPGLRDRIRPLVDTVSVPIDHRVTGRLANESKLMSP